MNLIKGKINLDQINIPKKIHYCWLSKNKFPAKIQKCMETWKVMLPDYEFILWDLNNPEINSNHWVLDAYNNKKYAFAADYIRLYAVYNYGGIYLDTDVEVLKNFDDLLALPYFIGTEGDENIEAGVFGAVKGCEWIGQCLEYYDDKSFIKNDGTFNTVTLPTIMKSQINKTRKIVEIINDDFSQIKFENSKLFMFPVDFFCAKNQGTGVIKISKRTYTIHHFAMSWIPKKNTYLPNIKRKLIAFLGLNTITFFIRILRLRELKDKFH